jgi:cytochrome P450
MQVLGRLLGVPPEMDAEFCAHAARLQNVINPLGDESARSDADASALRFRALIETLLASAERRPRDADLLAALVHDDVREERLGREELVGLATSLIMAGAETTGSLVNHGIRALLAHPGELARLRREPRLIGSAVEELGRFEFPTKFVARYALEPFALGGVRIDRGALLFGALGAANRDPAVFAEPDRLDLARAPGPVLTFGAGAHFCLGAALARAEARAMIGGLVARYPELHALGEPAFEPHFNIRRMRAYRLAHGPAARA